MAPLDLNDEAGASCMTAGYVLNDAAAIVTTWSTDPMALPMEAERACDPTFDFCEYLCTDRKAKLRAFLDVDVMIVLTDTKPLSSYKHWDDVCEAMHQRFRYTGWKNEKWGYCIIPIIEGTGLDQVHFTWSMVHVMEVLHALFPNKFIWMQYHDATFGLAETVTLVGLAQKTLMVTGQQSSSIAETGLLFFAEHIALVNARLIGIPPESGQHVDGVAILSSVEIDNMQSYVVRSVILARRRHFLTSRLDSIPQQQLPLCHTPLYGCKTDSIHSLLAAYTLLSLAINMGGWPQGNFLFVSRSGSVQGRARSIPLHPSSLHLPQNH